MPRAFAASAASQSTDGGVSRRMFGELLTWMQEHEEPVFIIATANFADQPNVLVYLAAAGLVGMFAVFPTAGEFGRGTEVTPDTPGPEERTVSTQP